MLMKPAAKSKVMPPPEDDDENTHIMEETNSPKESPGHEELLVCGEKLPGSGEFRGNGAAESGDELHDGDRNEGHKDDVPIESVEDGSKETTEDVEPDYEDGFMESTEGVKPVYKDVKLDGFMEKPEDVDCKDGFTGNDEEIL